jgi:hypothetical protein
MSGPNRFLPESWFLIIDVKLKGFSRTQDPEIGVRLRGQR